MMLVLYELKKLLADRLLSVLLLGAFLAVLLFACAHAEPRSYDRSEAEAILDAFRSSPTETYRTWQEKQKAYRAFLEDDRAETLPPFLSDYDAYRIAWEAYARQTRYRDRLDTVLHQTQGTDAVSVYLSARYRQNQSLRLSHHDMQALPALLDTLSFASLLALLLSVFPAISLSYADRRRHMELLLFACPRGRAHTRVCKLLALCFCNALSVAALFLGSLLPFWLQGILPWNAYLQNHESFFVCPYPITVLQAVLLLFLLTWLGSVVFGTTACLLGKYIPRQSVALLSAALIPVLLGTGSLFATPDGRSLLHLLSPFSFCDGDVAFGHAYTVSLGSHAAGGLPVVAFAWASMCVLLCVCYVWHHVPAARGTRRKRCVIALPTVRVPQSVCTVTGFEFAKQAIGNKAMLLALPLLLLFAWQISPTLLPDESYTEQTYRTYMRQLEGAYTPEKQQVVDHALSDAQNVLAQKQEMEALFAKGALTQAEMSAYMRRLGNAQAEEKALLRVADRLAFVRSHPDAEIVCDCGWALLYSLRMHLFPVLSVCAVCCGLFADEYKRGMHRLFPSPVRGRIAKSKYIFAICFACAVAFGFEAVQLALVVSRFELSLPFASSASVLQVQAFGSVPLLLTACASVLHRVIGYLLSAAVCTLCSRLLRQKHAAFVCGVLCALPWVVG